MYFIVGEVSGKADALVYVREIGYDWVWDESRDLATAMDDATSLRYLHTWEQSRQEGKPTNVYNVRREVVQAPSTPVDKVQEDIASLRALTIAGIARIAFRDWHRTKNGVYFGARPYLQAMHSMSAITDAYGLDDGVSIVRYFLANASTWRGPVAKAVKAELKRRLA